MDPQNPPLNIIIIGAGIAGLSTAISLLHSRPNCHITIFEKSTQNTELGAALHISPNAAHVLLQWGLNPAALQLVKSECTIRSSGETLEKFFESDEEGKSEERFGAPLWFAHRVDLHEWLKARVKQEDEVGGRAEIRLGMEVVGFVG